MFSKIVAAFFLFLASASAFVPATARTMMKAGALSMKMDVGKSIASMIPAAIATPAFASEVCILYDLLYYILASSVCCNFSYVNVSSYPFTIEMIPTKTILFVLHMNAHLDSV